MKDDGLKVCIASEKLRTSTPAFISILNDSKTGGVPSGMKLLAIIVSGVENKFPARSAMKLASIRRKVSLCIVAKSLLILRALESSLFNRTYRVVASGLILILL